MLCGSGRWAMVLVDGTKACMCRVGHASIVSPDARLICFLLLLQLPLAAGHVLCKSGHPLLLVCAVCR
jgi:hypothetical protein